MEELRNRLDEKNRAIEKKTQQANQATAEKNRLTTELNEIRDHMDIKDRKINVLQRKVSNNEKKFILFLIFFKCLASFAKEGRVGLGNVMYMMQKISRILKRNSLFSREKFCGLIRFSFFVINSLKCMYNKEFWKLNPMFRLWH